MRFEMNAIGRVESVLEDLADAPRQADEGAPPAWLVFEPEYADALTGLRPGGAIVVLTWLDRANRDVLVVHPRGEVARAREGVFRTRSPHRPNPIGLHEVTVTSVDGLRVGVDHLEAIDGTPIIDVKAVLCGDVSQR